MIRLVKEEDFSAWLKMRILLWPDCPKDEHIKEMKEIFGNLSATPVFICIENKEYIGFVEASVHEYAVGCHTHNVGYIEGWYIEKEYRKLGFGRKLINRIEKWALDQGFLEVASDAELDNEVSIIAHQKLGYEMIGSDSEEVKFLKEINVKSILFGNKDNKIKYNKRKASYAIIKNQDNMLSVIKTPKGYFLPGGGMEGLENYQENLTRELLEETGYRIKVGDFILKIEDYHKLSDDYYHTQAYFYFAELLDKAQDKSEDDHILVFLPYEVALTSLYPSIQRETLKLIMK